MKAIDIYNHIQGLNPTTNSVSSLGSYVSPMEQQLADNLRNEVSNALPDGTLAKKIIETSKHFTDKQLWVISFELLKNDEYCQLVKDAIEHLNAAVRREQKRKAEKKNRKAEKNSKLSKKEIPAYEVGMRVNHNNFGTGVIISVNADKVSVNFNGETKVMLSEFAKLTII